MFARNSYRIKCIESEADNKFRMDDLDLRKCKLLSRPDEITYRYRTTNAALLDEREKIRGVNISQLYTKMMPEQFNQPFIRWECPSQTVAHAIGIQ